MLAMESFYDESRLNNPAHCYTNQLPDIANSMPRPAPDTKKRQRKEEHPSAGIFSMSLRRAPTAAESQEEETVGCETYTHATHSTQYAPCSLFFVLRYLRAIGVLGLGHGRVVVAHRLLELVDAAAERPADAAQARRAEQDDNDHQNDQ